jgi:transcriptional antiterminator RfaH
MTQSFEDDSMNSSESGMTNTSSGSKWFAVHTKRFRETLAASTIAALGLEVFLPMVKVDVLDPSPIKVNAKPLFPSYLFARFNDAVFLESVDSARGVLYVVRSGLWPASLDDTVISEIQGRMEDDGLIRLHPRKLAPGDRVSIQSGPFAGMMGRVESELDDCKRVAILLEALWNARAVVERQLVQLEMV